MANVNRCLPLWLGALLFCFQLIQAKTVTYDFNVTWVTANPDGLHAREVVGINGQWPLPVIEVDKGDRLVVNMYNGLGDESTSIHFHGMFQNGTNNMDGPSGVTQCPIPPGSSFTYNFTINQNGTYWVGFEFQIVVLNFRQLTISSIIATHRIATPMGIARH